MPGEASREQMLQTVLKLALALCFRGDEGYLTQEQIITRKFTPTAAYSRACLRKLIEDQAIEYEWISSTNPLAEGDGLLYFRNPVGIGESHQIYNFEMSKKLLEFIEAAQGNELYILSIRIDVKAQECIEYTQFYAKKSQLNITNYEAANAKLKLMLMELKLENVYALLWRSIKMKEGREASTAGTTSFSEIVDVAFDKYSNSKKDGFIMEEYKRPSQIKPSMVSRIAEKLLKELPRFSRLNTRN